MYIGQTLERWYLNTEATWGQSKTRLTQQYPESMVVESTLLQRQKHIPLIGTSHSWQWIRDDRDCSAIRKCVCVCVCVCVCTRARVLWGRDVLDVIKDWPSSRRADEILNREDSVPGWSRGYFSFLAETFLDNEHVLCICNGGVTTFSGSHLRILSRAWLEGRLWWGWRKVCITLWVSIGRVYT